MSDRDKALDKILTDFERGCQADRRGPQGKHPGSLVVGEWLGRRYADTTAAIKTLFSAPPSGAAATETGDSQPSALRDAAWLGRMRAHYTDEHFAQWTLDEFPGGGSIGVEKAMGRFHAGAAALRSSGDAERDKADSELIDRLAEHLGEVGKIRLSRTLWDEGVSVDVGDYSSEPHTLITDALRKALDELPE